MSSSIATTTTQTQHWLLEKYSRSRTPSAPPSKRFKMNSGGRGGKSEHGGGEAEVEWDHYSQPQLSLRLKTTLSSSPSSGSSTSLPHVQSMLLAVSLDPLFREPNRSAGGQQNLTLDLLDLASFSSPAIRAATPKDQLPLKAVYKDAVLGLRYLTLDEGRGEGTFKRLQVKFTSVEERERFVGAVGAFVPAKPAVGSTTVKSSGKGKSSSKTATPRKTNQAALSVPSPASKQPTAQSSSFAHIPSTDTAAPPQANRTSSTFQLPLTLPNLPSQHAQQPSHVPPPPAASSPSTSHRLPRNLTTLLPNLSSSSQALPPVPPTLTPSEQLSQLSPAAFDALLQEALLEEGFEELVARVQATLSG
ncbi:hypothetical protein JCM8547_003914 [Rhodosporidiobolus lusitaniae]